MFFLGWLRGEKRAMKFGVPRIWREPTDHSHNCYFCMVDVSKHRSGKNAPKLQYPNIPSSLAPVLHSPDLPIPKPPEKIQETISSQSSSSSEHSNVSLSENMDEKAPYFPNQHDINDLVRDLDLTKSKSEILISRLKQWNLVQESVKVTSQRRRHELFSAFFSFYESLCYCNDIEGLFDLIGIVHVAEEWRLFIDSSSTSLKAVLLHNGNQYPSLPIAHSVNMKEEYINVKKLLDVLKYDDFGWEVIGDFKMITFLMGLQGGFTKYSCYLCLWDSRDTANHYTCKVWPPRSNFEIGQKNVKYEALVPQEKILLPPLHIKLGLIKQFVKQLDHDSTSFHFLRSFFPKLSEAKIKAGIFIGPQVRKLLESQEFDSSLKPLEKEAWHSFKQVVHQFLGNHKAENYIDLVDQLLQNFCNMGCRMSLKLHMLHSHLNVFKENMGAYSEEHGERFHQDIMDFERRYQGQYNEAMMGDYIWNLIRESDCNFKRKSRKSKNF